MAFILCTATTLLALTGLLLMPVVSATECPSNRTCNLNCSYGYQKDENGCNVCKCDDPCSNITCGANSKCTVVDFNGSKYPTCMIVPGCALPTCRMHCPFGFAKDENGCEVCSCMGDPCRNVTCNVGFQCDPVQRDEIFVGVCYPTTTSDCKPEECDVLCDFGKEQDEYGCDICECALPCKTVKCSPDFECIPQRRNNSREYVGACLPKKNCPTEECEEPCEYGRTKDANGCNMCACLDPCQDVSCDAGSACVPSQESGSNEEGYVGLCTPVNGPDCPIMPCQLLCAYGKVKDSNNCEMCMCVDPCNEINCDEGERCIVTRVNDTNPFRPTCIPDDDGCNKPLCTAFCDFGYAKDEQGCDTCDCILDPCEGVTCNSSQKCITENIRGSANYQVRCVPREVICPKIMCDSYCDFGYLLDSNGCDTCRCRPNPCLNVTCSFSSTCVPVLRDNSLLYEGRCVERVPCSLPECRYVCEFGGRELAFPVISMCSSCQCRNPCMDIDCLGNQCLLNSSKFCLGDMCHSIKLASCSAVRCPDPKCNRSCPTGFKKNGAGCQTCQCVDACESLKCTANEYCDEEELVCQPCKRRSCSTICLYGTVSCDSCECVEDPCATATCHPSQVCRPVYSPYRLSKLNYLCVDNRTTGCSDLQTFYSTSPLSPDKDIQLNCDSNDSFKPLQCHGDVCWCVRGDGKSYANSKPANLAGLNCGDYNYMVEDSVRIEMDYGSVRYNLQWDFKKKISQQLADMLFFSDQEVVITSLTPGSIIADFVILGTDEDKFVLAEESLNELRKEGTFKLLYNNNVFSAHLHANDTEPTGTPDPPHVRHDREQIKNFYVLVIFIPIVLALLIALVVFLLALCIAKYIKRNQTSTRNMSMSKEPIKNFFTYDDEVDVFTIRNDSPDKNTVSVA